MLRVLLVGNGPSASRYCLGRTIDRDFDLVVRFNCWRKDPITVGERCDIWIVNLSPYDTEAHLPKAAAEGYRSPKFIVNPGCGQRRAERVELFERIIRGAFGTPIEIESWENGVALALREQLGSKPTSGLIAIQTFLDLGHAVTLHGFDIAACQRCEPRHYWGGKSNIRTAHDPAAEGRWLWRKIAEGRVRLLQPDAVEPLSILQPGGGPRLPRRLHMVWLGGTPPIWVREFRDRLIELHPDWELRVWDDLPADADPMLRGAYQDAAQWCQRADIVRYLALFRYGGIYVDADCLPLRRMDPLLDLGPVWVPRQHDGRLNNAVIGALPEHPVLQRVLEGVRDTYAAAKATGNGAPPGRADYGPNLLTALKRDGLTELREVMKHYFLLYDRRESAHRFYRSNLRQRKLHLKLAQPRIIDGVPPFLIHLWGIDGSSKRAVQEG